MWTDNTEFAIGEMMENPFALKDSLEDVDRNLKVAVEHMRGNELTHVERLNVVANIT